jgi:hypothetical protein
MLITNVKIISNFEKEWCIFYIKEKNIRKKSIPKVSMCKMCKMIVDLHQNLNIETLQIMELSF